MTLDRTGAKAASRAATYRFRNSYALRARPFTRAGVLTYQHFFPRRELSTTDGTESPLWFAAVTPQASREGALYVLRDPNRRRMIQARRVAERKET